MTDRERYEADLRLANALRSGDITREQMIQAAARIEALNLEVEKYISAYRVAWNQAVANSTP